MPAYLPERRRIAYTPELGDWIAGRVADGDSLASLRDAFPDAVPPPAIVQGWRDTVPAFGALMDAADRARADALAHETVRIADSPRQAARARNAIQARQWLAERLDRARFGPRVGVDHGRATVEHVHTLSDAALVAIIERAENERGRVLEHEPAEPRALAGPGRPPAAQSEPPAGERGEGPSLRTKKIP